MEQENMATLKDTAAEFLGCAEVTKSKKIVKHDGAQTKRRISL